MFDYIISLENLFLAWKEFRHGKRKKEDVQEFEYNLEDNIFRLHKELKNKTYQHFNYTSFWIRDPKLRHIHKASVRDRVLHHAIFRILYPIFDKSFIFDSYFCRVNKGTHRAVKRLLEFIRRESKNYSRSCFVLKCDIKKFFDSINHDILISLIERKVGDKNAIWLITEIVRGFSVLPGKGVPLGNITSQLFANIYLNEFDWFAKHELRIKYYIRYSDDFVIIDKDKESFRDVIPNINKFLQENLEMSLHPNKIYIRKAHQGIDFLGYVVLLHYILVRTKTKKRMFKKLEKKISDFKSGFITKEKLDQSVQSYLGYLKHARSHKVILEIKRIFNYKI